MSQKKRRQIIDQFRDDMDGLDSLFLISSTNLIGCGANLFRASYSVLFEPCWTAGDEMQVYGRINRVSSPGRTQSYRLYISEHEIESGIRLRQEARGEVRRDTLEVSAVGQSSTRGDDVEELPALPGSKNAPLDLESYWVQSHFQGL